MVQIVIVAGGKGTRLSQYYGELPKSLVPIYGKPILLHQLEWAQREGAERVEIFAGHHAHKIIKYVNELDMPSLKIRVHVEETPLGNAGAVLGRLDQLEPYFFVVYGDIILDLNLSSFENFHVKSQADFSTAVHPNDHPHDSDLIECDELDQVTNIYLYPHQTDTSLPNLVNAAVYAVQRDSMRQFFKSGAKADFTKSIIPNLLKVGGKVCAYRTNEYIKDVGTPERIAKAENDFRRGTIRTSRISSGRAVVFLDRDGTLNADDGHVARPESVTLLPGVAQALKKLRECGYQLVVVTNQPIVARGEASELVVAKIHQELEWLLGQQGAFVDRIYYCPHHPDSGYEGERPELKLECNCRKPQIGMFERARAELDIDPRLSWMVGDRTADIEFANRAGLRSVLLQTGDAGQDKKYESKPHYIAADLMNAAAIICENSCLNNFQLLAEDKSQ